MSKRLTSLSDGVPAPLVSLIGHKQYKRCARDIYYFTQVELLLFFAVFNMSLLLWCFFLFQPSDCTFMQLTIAVYYMCEATCLCDIRTSTHISFPWTTGCCEGSSWQEKHQSRLASSGFRFCYRIFVSTIIEILERKLFQGTWRPM